MVQGADNKWRFEIPDQAAVVKPFERIDPGNTFRNRGTRNRPLNEIIEHPEFFAAYPRARYLDTSLEVTPARQAGGSFFPSTGEISVRGPERHGPPGPDELNMRSSLLHEMQHAVKREKASRPAQTPMPCKISYRHRH